MSVFRLWLSIAVLTAGCIDQRVSEPVSFAAFGDTPYTVAEESMLVHVIEDMNRADLDWVVHIGDIERFSCSESTFATRFAMFESIRHPVVYTPGDNEWTDCHMAFRGGFSPLERLQAIRSTFFPSPGQTLGSEKMTVESQSSDPSFSEFVENVRWIQDGVVFLTVHIVGSHNGLDPFDGRTDDDDQEVARRETATLDWIRSGFATAKRLDARAVIIAMHADLSLEADDGSSLRQGFDMIVSLLREEVGRFGGSVLLIHGDSHVLRMDKPLKKMSGSRFDRFTRLEVFGAPDVGWIKVSILPGRPAHFSIVPKQF